MAAIDPRKTDRLLGLFAHSNMNVALDKMDGRRSKLNGINGRVMNDYGFPDQPLLDTVEFDRAIKVVQDFARQRGDTLVIVTADHECSGVALIGGSTVSDARLQELVREGGVANVRDKVVGVYEKAGFHKYRMATDGYPQTTDIDNRLS